MEYHNGVLTVKGVPVATAITFQIGNAIPLKFATTFNRFKQDESIKHLITLNNPRVELKSKAH